MINLKNISFKYKQNLPYVIKNLNLCIDKKERILFAGKNGAGKTTISKIISGILPKIENGILEGEFFLFNINVKNLTSKQIFEKVGILLQDFESQLVTTTVKEELIFYPLNKNTPYKEAFNFAKKLSEKFKIEKFFDRDITELSGGEKQKVALLALLSSDPDIIILDEPFTDIDQFSRDEIIDFLKGEEKTILFFEQSLDYYDFFTRIIILKDGEIIYDGNDPFKKEEILKSAGLTIPFIKKIFPTSSINDACVYIKENFIFKEEEYEKIISNSKNNNKEIIISIKNLKYRYKGYKNYVLNNINFEIEKGDFIVIAGPNGSGKTTLMKILAGIISIGKNEGDIIKSDEKLKISYIYQNPDNQIFAETVFDEVSFILKISGFRPDIINEKTENILKVMGLFEKKDADPFNLPKGDRQKVACASLLVGEPDVLIMDEPTTGLGYPSLESLMQIICELNASGKTILMITHDIEVISRYGTKMLLMNNGEILFFGNKREVFNNDMLLKKSNLKKTDIMELTNRINGKIILNEMEFKTCWSKK
ncbi:MAG: energy-coupling factor ABC transporter ATP-binding protein [Candidatus Goldbacteria bacterium]|nr:energy-coupling factor ABC transporter ATP-binding protein [Candidatus Goldiibacteriota bacterium]